MNPPMSTPVTSRMRVLIRADASETIGHGHIMRCLTLAAALAKAGAECRFICRELPGHAQALISRYDFPVNLIPGSELSSAEAIAEDAKLTLQFAGLWQPHWVIVDHYELNAEWQSALKSTGCRLLALDDWPHRQHQSDLLLDQNLAADAEAYSTWTDSTCRILTGAHFSLLRPEFMRKKVNRIYSENNQLKILINLGGADLSGYSADILEQLMPLAQRLNLQLVVLVNQRSVSYTQIAEKITTGYYPFTVQLQSYCQDMCSLYDSVDLAIGAGGISTWERASRGLPAALVVIADNQQATAQAAVSAGMAVNIGDFTRSAKLDLPALADVLKNPQQLQQMSQCAAALFDGCGAERIVREMLLKSRQDLQLTAARPQDCTLFYQWQKEPGARRFFRNPQVPVWSDHRSWYLKILPSRSVILYKIMLCGMAVGYIRLDIHNRRDAEISVLVARRFQGLGLAAIALNLCASVHSERRLYAAIKNGNYASRRSFRLAGFRPSGKEMYVRHP